MKTRLLVALAALFIVATSCSITKRKENYAYSRNATASISRINLFVTSDGKSTASIQPTVFWSQFDATKRSSIVAVLPDAESGNVNVKVLAENTPDAAIESLSKITAKMSHKDFSAQVAGEFARSIAQIKRSSAVENFRTISYRLAEIVSANGEPDTTVVNLFRSLISSSVATAREDARVAEKELEASMKEADVNLKKETNRSAALETLRKELEKATDPEVKKEIRAQIVQVQLGMVEP